jgi:hypothetical protein
LHSDLFGLSGNAEGRKIDKQMLKVCGYLLMYLDSLSEELSSQTDQFFYNTHKRSRK